LSFQKVMFTDSKLFSLHPSAATCSAQRWHAYSGSSQAFQGSACVYESYCFWCD
jgi:hypothetical protein